MLPDRQSKPGEPATIDECDPPLAGSRLESKIFLNDLDFADLLRIRRKECKYFLRRRAAGGGEVRHVGLAVFAKNHRTLRRTLNKPSFCSQIVLNQSSSTVTFSVSSILIPNPSSLSFSASLSPSTISIAIAPSRVASFSASRVK